jgi:hypothetical protein
MIVKNIPRDLMTIVCVAGFILSQANAQTPSPVTAQAYKATNVSSERAGLLFPFSSVRQRLRPVGFSLMPTGSAGWNMKPTNVSLMAGPNFPVVGGGTLGRLTKWTGFTSSNSFLGDSTIFEDKFGNVGIGTDSPTSRLTVAGTIQSLSGGFKFPDGTVQTTAGIAPNQVVRSLNGLMGDLSLVPGSNITITPGANTVTIAASGLLTGVSHDATLVGDGSLGSPLGVAVPLLLSGSLAFGGAVIEATNTAEGGNGLIATGGGDGSMLDGGNGVVAFAGPGSAHGGVGMEGSGGLGQVGGTGVVGRGGSGTIEPGQGVFGIGGEGIGSVIGGVGVFARGGNAIAGGGTGIRARGGLGPGGEETFGLAGSFQGDVEMNSDLNVTGTKNFKIDHPLDPENKYLYHAAIESSEVLNLYSGNVKLDSNGEAVVHLPEWFQAINRDFRYSLTAIGAPASGLYISQEIANGKFQIAGGVAGMKVSWQVTGVRSDRAMLKRPFKVVENKPERERGTYISPQVFDQPEERGIEWSRHPELMQKEKEQREALRRKGTK